MKKVVLVLAIAALAIAGCGGSSSKDSDSGSNSNSNNSGSSNTGKDFTSLLDKQNDAKLRVTYEFGEDKDVITISRNGKDKIAYLTDDKQIISQDDTVISCSGLPDDPECQELSGTAGKAAVTAATAIFTIPTTVLSYANRLSDTLGDESSETIAGRDATCTTITLKDASGIIGNLIGNLAGLDLDAGYKVCLDKETGVLLQWSVVGTNDFDQQIQATEVGDPKDSDFEPPAEPEKVTVPTIPDITLPGGITIPSIPGLNP